MIEKIDICIKQKIYDDINNNITHTALKDFYLEIPGGEFCSIIGPSGCGKSTLLNIVSGLDKKYTGRLKIGKRKEIESIKIAYMFQTPRLLPWLNVIDNVEVVLSKSQKEKGRAETLLNLMGLKDFLYFYPNKLSGGMQRRVALARSFASEPELFILDEPFVSLDAPAANLLRDMLVNLWLQEPTTILFVTHDIEESIYLSDKIIFLSKAPARVLMKQTVNILRPRNKRVNEISALKSKILGKHRKILEGKI